MGTGVGIFLVCGVLLVQCLADVHEGHGHSHGHGADKYKREFNEPHAHFDHEDHFHDHGHRHSHGGHDHDGHQHLAQGASKYFREYNEPVEEEVQHEHEHEQEESGHDHDHEHVHEPAKEQPDNHVDVHDHHGHSDDHHGHSHDHHGHSDDHHGHTHQHKPEDLTYSVKHEHVGHDHDHVQEKPSTRTTSRRVRSTLTMWLEAIGSTLLISAAPFFILFFIPLDSNSAEQQPMLKVLLSFASGGLLGDAFLHLIPHAISPHTHDGDDHSHSHSHSHSDKPHDHSAGMVVGLWVLAGMITFLIVEKFVRIVKGGHSHGHGHSHGSPAESAKNGDVVTTDKKDDKESDKNLRKRKKTDKASDDKDEVADDEEEEVQSQTSEDKHETHEEDIKVAGYLNLAADFTHNFTDGLAIGASFLVGRSLGIITTITILLHEVPHEIGDFAILIQSGCTKRKAMCLQLLTAVGALAGCTCGLLAEGIGSSATVWVLPFTAGGFIYIATVSVIPELLEDTKLGQSIKEIIGLLVGVFMMVLIAKIE